MSKELTEEKKGVEMDQVKLDLEENRRQVVKFVEKMDTARTVVKKTNSALKISIEGNKLVAAQFDCGAKYNVYYSEDAIELCINESGHQAVADSRPSIDIQDEQIGAIFKEGDAVEVSYYEHGLITLKRGN